MRLFNFRNFTMAVALSLIALFAASEVVTAQTWRDYKEMEKQQRKAQKQQRKYERQQQRYYQQRYRVYNNGGYYQTDERGAQMLRQAVNYGYQQGFNAGKYDAQRGYQYGYNAQDMYRSGAYGYQGNVDRSQYRYYFQQGFQRGYQDGYNRQNRYGNNGRNILGSILNSILNIQQY